MYSRIIFVADQPYSERNAQRFGFDRWESKGISPEFWDFSPFLAKDYAKSHINNFFSDSRNRKFSTESRAIEAIELLDKDCILVWLLYGIGFKHRKIISAIERNAGTWGGWRTNLLPLTTSDARNKSIALALSNPGRFAKKALGALANRCYRRYCPKPKFIIRGARAAHSYSLPRNNITRDIRCHSLDYDIYLDLQYREAKSPQTIVFLDEYLPYHPDYSITKDAPPASPLEYYSKLNRFFTEIEKTTGKEIVIAGHPRSSESTNKKMFNGRKVIYGETASLVRDSYIVILHCSAAVNFAVMFRKPLLFLSMDSLENSFMRPLMKNMSQELGYERYNIDQNQPSTLSFPLSISENHYNQYQHTYIKSSNSPEVNTWDMLFNELTSPNVRLRPSES